MQNGKRQGYGTDSNVYADGRTPQTYTGTWRRDLFHGMGTMQNRPDPWPTYEGQWCDGKRQGIGKGTGLGSVYQGGWINDVPEGCGEFTFSNRDHYVGRVHNGKMHGEGYIKKYSDNSKYMGGFINGQRDGEGVWTDDDCSFKGRFKNDLRHGKARVEMFKEDGQLGSIYEVSYTKDKICGAGSVLFTPSGNRFEGTWLAGFIQGHGKWTNCKPAWCFEGHIEQNKPQKGVLTTADGLSHQVEYADDCADMIHGPYPDGVEMSDLSANAVLGSGLVAVTAATAYADTSSVSAADMACSRMRSNGKREASVEPGADTVSTKRRALEVVGANGGCASSSLSVLEAEEVHKISWAWRKTDGKYVKFSGVLTDFIERAMQVFFPTPLYMLICTYIYMLGICVFCRTLVCIPTALFPGVGLRVVSL